MFRKDIVIPSGAVALALCVFSIQADPLKPTQYGDFDRYVLALSSANRILPEHGRT